jgi:cytochrome c-type biogenesis protein CcmF
MAPLFSELFRGEKVASTPEFFNRWMVPLGLTLFSTLGVCLVAGRRKADSKASAVRSFAFAILFPGIFATLSAIVGTAVLGFEGPASLLAFLLLGLVAAGVVRELFHILRKTASEKNLPGARLGRIGAQIVHAAVVLLFLGFTGEAYTVENSAVMNPGDVLTVGKYQLKFLGLRDDTDYQKYAVFADLETSANGRPMDTYSAARFYYHAHSEQPINEVSIVRSLPEDLFLILGNIDEKTEAATIRAVVNPLVSFIWIGGALLVIGTVVGLIGRSKSAGSAQAPRTHRLFQTASAAVAAALFAASFLFFAPIYSFLFLAALALMLTLATFSSALFALTTEEEAA